MGRQVNFFMHPDDLADFDAWLRSREGMLVLAPSSETAGPRRLGSAIVGRMGEEDLTVYLARGGDLAHVVSRPIPGRGYLIDESRSPVVEFARCYFDGKLLRRGRLYYATGYWDAKAQWRPVPDEFARWANAILGKIRSSYKARHASHCVGPHAARWAKQTEGVLTVT